MLKSVCIASRARHTTIRTCTHAMGIGNENKGEGIVMADERRVPKNGRRPVQGTHPKAGTSDAVEVWASPYYKTPQHYDDYAGAGIAEGSEGDRRKDMHNVPNKTQADDAQNAKCDDGTNGSADKATRHARGKDGGATANRHGKPARRKWMPVVMAVCGIAVGAIGGIGVYTLTHVDKPIAITEVSKDDAKGVIVARYVYDGKSHDVTAQDMIDAMGTNATKKKDGNYAMPSADTAITVARDQIVMSECDKKNITVSDKELKSYMKTSYGTTDMSEIAKEYNIDEKTILKGVKKSARSHKLYLKVTGTTDDGAPEMPASDADTKTLGKYIIRLLGDNWDDEKGTWANTDSDFYDALGKKFDPSSATQEQAQKVYQLASQHYQENYTNAYFKWSDYVNGLMSKCTIDIYTLGSNQ